MGETLLSVGLDVGTTSTQMVVSELTIENQASAFSVPEMSIASRKIRYESPVYFTPLLGQDLVDGQGIREIVKTEYRAAGIARDMVDTGAVIITGETSRKENARAVLDGLVEYAGDFVVATAGPDLESVLAAKGAGAVSFSAETGKSVLHMDIGGGTSNLAWIEDGIITKTGCLNVGGRLIKVGESGDITYVSPVLEGLCDLKVGDHPTETALFEVAKVLTQALEMAAGLRERTDLLEKLWTVEAGSLPSEGRCPQRGRRGERLETYHPSVACGDSSPQGEPWVLSFSGGVADCIDRQRRWLEFGDMGPLLGRAIRESRLCAGEYRLGEQTIRATVIGAGSHSAQLSGSTVFYRDVEFPLKNLPVVRLSGAEKTGEIRRKLASQDTESVVAMTGFSGSYRQVKELAEELAAAFAGRRILLAVEADMAKALGQAMALNTDKPVLCIDRVRLQDGDYLDVGAPVGPALPVVVKTLVLQQ